MPAGEPGGGAACLGRRHLLPFGGGVCRHERQCGGGCADRAQPHGGIRPGAEVYRNYDRPFTLRVERSRTRRGIPATARVETWEDGVRITFTDCEGFTAAAERHLALETARNPEANAASLRQQAARSGDTIFEVRDVELRGTERFVPASLLAELRREGLDRLLAARMARRFEHRILPENPAARYPSERLAAEENVTNRLAEAFSRDHGVQRIERGLDLAPTTAGHPVMRTAYCIRREIGECLKEHPRLRGELWLERGRHRYRLEFDCVRCEMSLGGASEERNEKKPNK